jgi:hypothetical protein
MHESHDSAAPTVRPLQRIQARGNLHVVSLSSGLLQLGRRRLQGKLLLFYNKHFIHNLTAWICWNHYIISGYTLECTLNGAPMGMSRITTNCRKRSLNRLWTTKSSCSKWVSHPILSSGNLVDLWGTCQRGNNSLGEGFHAPIWRVREIISIDAIDQQLTISEELSIMKSHIAAH